MLLDVVTTTIVIIAGWFLISTRTRRIPGGEARLIAASFVAHVVGSFATVFVSEVFYNGIVDFNGFRNAGRLIAKAMREDFWGVTPRTLLVFFHQEVIINVPLDLEPRGGGTTKSMWILAAWGDVLFGGSYQATHTAAALFSFSGKAALFLAIRDKFLPAVRRQIAFAVLLVPSVVYWNSGLIKEGLAVGGLGYAIYGIDAVLIRRKPTGLLPLVFGVTFVGLIKPYILMPLAVGTAAWMYTRSAAKDGKVQIRPIYLVTAAAVAVVGVLLVGRVFPQFSLSTLGEQAAKMQGYGRKAAGGSFYMLGDPTQQSLAGQIKFAPIAMFTALFRPTLLDARNPMLFANSLETTALMVISARLVFERGWRWMINAIISHPLLSFCLAFLVPMALGVGLVSNNLGTLSRYRAPMVPFLVMLLLVLWSGKVAVPRPAAAAARPKPEPVLPPVASRPSPPPLPVGPGAAS